MSRKRKAAAPPVISRKTQPAFFAGRDGLGAYCADPAVFPSSRVIYHTDSFVVINDLYPKSTVHTLLLPRDGTRNVLHPFDAFEDADFLSSVRQELSKVRTMVADELRRKYGRFSVTEKPRIGAMEADQPPDELPAGRDWSQDVISGIHAHPSMTHLHVHVMSRDMVSDCLKHRRHYESFNTPFLVDIDQFPLAKNDPRRHPGRSGYLDQDLKCWRCGKNFGSKFGKLKTHLSEEFEEWKRQ